MTRSASTRRLSFLVAACLPLVVLGAACSPASSTGSPTDSPAPSPTVTPSASSTPDASPEATPSVTRAPGCTGPILDAAVCYNTSTAVAVPDGMMTVHEVGPADTPPAWSTVVPLSSLQPDGTLAGARSPGAAQGYRLPFSVGVYGPDGTLAPVATEGDQPVRGVVGTAYDGTHLVWKESTDVTQSAEQWWIKTVIDGTVKTLSASTDFTPDGQLPNTGTLMAIVGDSVVWAAGMIDSATPDSPGAKSVILSAKLDGSAPATTIADNAYYPTTDGQGNVYYVTLDDAQNPVIMKRQPDGTTTTVVARPDESQLAMVGLAADATHIAWLLATSTTDATGQSVYIGWIYVLDTTTQALTEVAVGSAGGGGNVLSLSHGWLGWGNGTGQGDTQEYLMNLATGAIYVLADSAGGSWVGVSYPAVAWKVPPDSTRFAYVRTFVGLLTPTS